jgi:hypothetical protein
VVIVVITVIMVTLVIKIAMVIKFIVVVMVIIAFHCLSYYGYFKSHSRIAETQKLRIW